MNAAILDGAIQHTPVPRADRSVVSKTGTGGSRQWVHHVIELLDAAIHQLHHRDAAAHCTLLKATSLLRKEVDPQTPPGIADGRGRLPAWKARKVREYVDSHITDRVLAADLAAVVELSAGHFARSFKRTFGLSPHAFVMQRRLELATQYMLQTDDALSDIALRCGFTDQAHLSNHFRQATGETPAAWRRERWIPTSQRSSTGLAIVV